MFDSDYDDHWDPFYNPRPKPRIPTGWLTTTQVARMHHMTPANVGYLCANRRLNCKKFSRPDGAREWRIDPTSARAYVRKMPIREAT